MVRCEDVNCKYVYCVTCKEKVGSELGAAAFEGGCPRCLGLCCCFDKSYNCSRKYHCYKKCPVTFGKREIPKKRKLMTADEESASAYPPPKSLILPASASAESTPATVVNEPTASSPTGVAAISPGFSSVVSYGSDLGYTPPYSGLKVNLATPVVGFSVMEDDHYTLAMPASSRQNQRVEGVNQLLMVADALQVKEEEELCTPDLLAQGSSNFSPIPQESISSSHDMVFTPASGSLLSSTSDAFQEYPFQSPEAKKAGGSSMFGHSFAGVQGEAGKATATSDLSPLEMELTWTSDNDDLQSKDDTVFIPSSLSVKRENN